MQNKNGQKKYWKIEIDMPSQIFTKTQEISEQ